MAHEVLRTERTDMLKASYRQGQFYACPFMSRPVYYELLSMDDTRPGGPSGDEKMAVWCVVGPRLQPSSYQNGSMQAIST